MGKEKRLPLNPLEVKDSKAAILNLSELAVKQLVLGIIQVLSLKPSVTKDQFLGILSDAREYNEIIKKA